MSLEHPQSIVHHAIRLERKIVRSLKRATSARSLLLGKKKSTIANKSYDSNEEEPTIMINILRQKEEHHSKNLQIQSSHSKKDSSIAFENLFSDRETLSKALHSFNSSIFSLDMPDDLDLEYRTVKSEEEISHEPSFDNGVCFIHFFVANHPLSEAIDRQMELLARNVYSGSTFCRIEKARPCSLADKLNIISQKVTPAQPLVIALKDGKLIDRIFEFTTPNCIELAHWVSTIELVLNDPFYKSERSELER